MIDDYNIIMPGRIVSYDPVEQLSAVLISNSRTYSTSSSTERQSKRVQLVDVPTYTPGGGGWHMTFPIKKDDPCLISFSQFGYDHWLFEDKDAAGVRQDGQPMPWTERRFSLRDGFCQVGWNTIPRAVAEYHASHSQWRNVDATQVISLNDDASISIDSTVNLTITAPQVTINGNLDVTGQITTPSIEVNSVEVAGHIHTGVHGDTDVMKEP